NSRIMRPGESNDFWIDAPADKTLTFEVTSGAAGFDPSVAIYEPTGSWFDPNRLNRVASNDEPLYFPGLSTNARLVQRFVQGGKYCVKVQGFSGQGAPDFSYQLRIAPGVTPPPVLHPEIKTIWEEREFTRRLAQNRLEELDRRGAASSKT